MGTSRGGEGPPRAQQYRPCFGTERGLLGIDQPTPAILALAYNLTTDQLWTQDREAGTLLAQQLPRAASGGNGGKPCRRTRYAHERRAPLGHIDRYGVKIAWTEVGNPQMTYTLACEEQGKGCTSHRTFIPVLIVGPQAEDLAETLEPGDVVLGRGQVLAATLV